MGHAYIKNLEQLTLRYLYAKGTASIEDFLAVAKKRGEGLHCAEGTYDKEDDFDPEGGIVHLGVDEALLWQLRCKYIEPVFASNVEEGVFNLRMQTYLDHIEDWEVYNKIKFKLSKEGRKAYLEKRIQILDHVEN